jgi:hypothetical protein
VLGVIVVSIVLVAVACGMLLAGLLSGSDPLYYGSIVSSVLAALALVVGVRRLPAARIPEEDFDRAGAPPLAPSRVPSPPRDAGAEEVSEPPDEPPRELLSGADLDRVANLGTPVVVIDGRPRYHLSDCLSLLGRSVERLPVSEAAELGFSPCGQCSPVAVLLAGVPSG